MKFTDLMMHDKLSLYKTMVKFVYVQMFVGKTPINFNETH